MKKAIIDCIRGFIKECPDLKDNAQINVDYLNVEGKDKDYWSIEKMEGPEIVKEKANILGTKSERQCLFVLATRSFYSPIDDKTNSENLQKLEAIAEWIHEMNKQRKFPTLNEKETAFKIEITSGPYLFGTDKTNTIARYEMQGKLSFYKEEL